MVAPVSLQFTFKVWRAAEAGRQRPSTQQRWSEQITFTLLARNSTMQGLKHHPRHKTWAHTDQRLGLLHT